MPLPLASIVGLIPPQAVGWGSLLLLLACGVVLFVLLREKRLRQTRQRLKEQKK